MIKVRYNIGSKPHEKEFNNSKELGDWIIENYESIKITIIHKNNEYIV